jgi:hypothetical protein
MRAGPGLQAFLSGTKHKQHILFERHSAVDTMKASKVRNMHHIQLNHRSPAMVAFHPSTSPRLISAGFLNHVQAGQAAPQALRMEAAPLKNTRTMRIPSAPNVSNVINSKSASSS